MGRTKGAVNKTSYITKQVITDLLSDYQKSGLLNRDFCELEAKDRLTIAERLFSYVLPKMQSTAVTAVTTVSDIKISLDTKLKKLADDNS